MNTLVDAYRQRVPNDSRSDEDLTLLFGKAHDADGRYSAYPDFVEQYTALKTPEVPFSAELRRGVSRGVGQLKESAYGLGALGADLVGAQGVKDALLTRYVESRDESMADSASGVPRVEDVKDVGTGIRFALGKAGELIPQIGEALVVGAAGALAGSAAAPGPGTVAGAAAGLTEGLVARQSARAIIKAGLDKILSKTTIDAAEKTLIKDQIERVASKKAIDGALNPQAAALLSEAIKAKASGMGALGANLVNFYGIGAGTIYGDLASREGVEDKDARVAALVGGVGSALANAPLPTIVVSRFFPGVGREVAESYIKRLAVDATIEIPVGATSETLDELVQIAAEKYADPKRRNTPLDDQDLSRLLNAAVVGAGAGGMVSPISAIPGPKAESAFPEEVSGRYFASVTDERKRQLIGLDSRMKRGPLNEQDEVTVRTLTADERNYLTALSDLPEELKNKETVAVTKAKEVVKDEGQKEGEEGQVLKPAQPVVNPPVETPSITPEQVKSLVDLKYDQTDIDNMAVDQAQTIIDAQLVSPKATRRNKFRDAATTPVAKEAADEAALKLKIEQAAAKTNPNPTTEQAEAGTYKKGKAKLHGMDLEIESPKGEIRQGVDKNGKPWQSILRSHYGQILGTKDRTGEPIDISVGDSPNSERVWVIDQIDPDTLDYDEPKVKFGFNTPEEAIEDYKSGFSDGSGQSRIGGITEMTRDDFLAWIKSDATMKAVRYQKPESSPVVAPAASTLTAAATPATPVVAAASVATADDAVARDVEKETGFTLVKKDQTAAFQIPTAEQLAAMTPELQAQYKALKEKFPPEWEFTDNRTGSKTLGRTFRAPLTATKVEMLESYKASAPEYANQKDSKEAGDKTVATGDAAVSGVVKETAGTINGEARALTIDDVDAGRLVGADPTAWSWYRVDPAVADVALVRELSSDLGTPSGTKTKRVSGVKLEAKDQPSAKPQQSRRILFVLDKTTGQVHAVTVYKSNKLARVTLFDERLREKGRGKKKGDNSITLQSIITSSDFEPLASMRTTELTEYFHQQIGTREQFEQQFGQPLDALSAKAKADAAAGEATLNKNKKPTNENAEEDTDEEVAEETTTQAVEISEAPEVKLTKKQVGLIASLPEFKTIIEFAKLVQEQKITKEQVELLGRIKKSEDPDVIIRLAKNGTRKTLEFYDSANAGRTNYAATLGPVEQTGTQPAPAAIPDTTGPRPEGPDQPAPAVASTEDSAGKPQQAGDAGNKVADTTSRAVADQERKASRGALRLEWERKVAPHLNASGNLKVTADAQVIADYQRIKKALNDLDSDLIDPNSARPLPPPSPNDLGAINADDDAAMIPTGEQEVSPEHQQILDDIYTAAARAGIDITLVQGAVRRGGYNSKARAISHVFGAAIGSHDVRIAYHEVAHDVFAMMPEDIRRRLVASIESLNDNQVGIDTHPDTRIRQANPNSLTPDNLQEERAIAAVEQRLVKDGFNPRDSAGYARSFVRALKEFYFKVAMGIQQMFGWDPSPDLALAYFENSVRRFLAGDTTKYSLIDMLGLAKPTVAGKYQKWFRTARSSGERMNSDGLTYDHVANTTEAAMDYNVDNALKFTLPVTDDVKATRTVMVEREVAVFNHLLELQQQAAATLAENKVVAESNKTPLEWLRKTLKLPDPQRGKDAFNGRLDFDRQPIQFDPAKRLDGFKDQSNQDFVIDKLYRDAQSMAYKVDQAARALGLELQQVEDSRTKLVDDTKKARARYADLDEQARLLQGKLISHVQKMLEFAAKPKGKRSVIATQLKVLDLNNAPATYAKTFEGLVASKALTGQKIVSILDTAANTPTIDFKQKADEIRKAMRESGKFGELLQETPAARARLATVIALAKADPRLLAELELRRLASGRAEIEAKIDAIIDGKAKPKPRRVLTRQSSIEDRILAEYSEVGKKLKDITKGESEAKAKLAAIKLVEPVVNTRLAELTGLVGATIDFTFKDGAEYHPVKAGMTTEAALKKKATLVLDASGEPTNPKVLEDQAIDMKMFLMEREERYAKGDLTAKDKAYQTVEREYQELANNLHYRLDLEPSDRLGFELHLMPEFSMIGDSFATPAAQLFKKAGNHYARIEAFLKNIGDGVYDRGYRIRRELHKLLPGLNDDNLQTFIDTAKTVIEEQTSDLVETYASQPEKLKRLVWVRVREELLRSRLAKDIGLPRVIDRFMPTFEKLNDLEHEMGDKYFTGQVLKGVETMNPVTGSYEPAGLKVKDPGIKVMDDDGNLVDGLRRHFKKGWRTFGGRRMSDGFSQLAYAMRHSGFATFEKAVAGLDEVYRESPEDARAKLNKFFTNKQHGEVVNEWFLRMLAERAMPMFEAPTLEDGVTTIDGDPMKIRQALDAAPKGDVMAFIENMYDLHEGDGEFADYLQKTADRLAEYAAEVQQIADKYFPDDGKDNPMTGIRNMSPNVLIDAREISGLPAQWFAFQKFDKPNLHRLARHIAAEVAFGRNQEYLASLLDTVAVEAKDAMDRLNAERARIRAKHPAWTDKQVEKETKKIEGYENLKKFEDRASNVGKASHKLGSFFRKDNSPDATLFAMTRVTQTISRLLVNNPASAIYQDNTNFDLLFRYGANRAAVKATLKTLKRNLHESVASLAQTIGLQMSQSEFSKRFNSLGLQYSERVKRFGDEFRRWENEGAISYGARLIEESVSSPINLAGKESRNVLFRPTGLFDWRVMIADRSMTDGMWNFTSGFVTKGIEFYKKHPELVDDHTLTDAELDLGKGEAMALAKLKADMQNFGLNFDEMVRASIKRNDGTVFTDEEAMRLHSLAMFLISSQSNIATMTASAWNNSVVRWMIPLLGWMWRRTMDVTGKRLSPEGQNQARALAMGLTGIAAASVGGLALSAIVDKYYEELVNRKRNLRPMSSAAGLIEHTARAGSLGLFGELANSMVTAGAGGDNRIFSLDKRVVAMSSIMSVQKAISNLINQEEFDYQRVGRPLFAAMGGNGILHYLGLANNMFSLDNVESRLNARTNAQNYLRVIGRELDLPVREYTGGSGTPTPMTPHISRMEQAAYAGNAVDFRNSYIDAIKQAQKDGNDDPVGYVQRSFAAKNPLRSVFATAPSEREYDRILLALPEDGREAVMSAVAAHNRFAESIGARAFEGKAEKKPSTARATNPFGADRISAFRAAAFAR